MRITLSSLSFSSEYAIHSPIAKWIFMSTSWKRFHWNKSAPEAGTIKVIHVIWSIVFISLRKEIADNSIFRNEIYFVRTQEYTKIQNVNDNLKLQMWPATIKPMNKKQGEMMAQIQSPFHPNGRHSSKTRIKNLPKLYLR